MIERASRPGGRTRNASPFGSTDIHRRCADDILGLLKFGPLVMLAGCAFQGHGAVDVVDAPVIEPDTTPAPTCSDGAHNGNETQVDCGGGCSPCGLGLECAGDT